jgi:hypothetical protein
VIIAFSAHSQVHPLQVESENRNDGEAILDICVYYLDC